MRRVRKEETETGELSPHEARDAGRQLHAGSLLAAGNGLLILSVVIVLGAQLRIALIEKPQCTALLNAAAQKLTAVRSAQLQTDEAIEKREQQIKRSGAMETQYAALLTELLELSKVDPDAKLIVQKWKIQQQGAPQADETASSRASVSESKPNTLPVSKPKSTGAPQAK